MSVSISSLTPQQVPAAAVDAARAPAPAPVRDAQPAGAVAAAAAAAAAQAREAQVKATDRPVAPPVRFDPKEMRQNLQEALDRLNDQMKRNGRNLNFSMDEAVDRTVITVKNTQTGEVVRQIPDETVLRVAHNIEKVKGMLMNETI